MDAVIQKVIRVSDNKEFEIDQPVDVDGTYQGIICAIGQFDDGFRVALDDGSDVLDEDERIETYFLISEID